MVSRFSSFLLILTLFGSLTTSVFSETINVPEDFETINAAIDAADEGDTVLVAAGEYAEHVNFDGQSISVISAVGPGQTIINGTGNGPCVTFTGGEERTSLIQGFTLTNGLATGDGYGGGIIIERSSPTVRGNIIGGNQANTGGGGISASFDGCDPLIQFNLIIDNGTNGGGGGISFYQCRGTVLNNTIIGNSADQGGSGINIPFTDGMQIVNNIILGNENQGIAGWEAQNVTCCFNNFFQNQGGNYNGIQPGEGSIADDPEFVDANNGDYHLTEGSPCIDVGDPDSDPDPDGTRADLGAYYFHQQIDQNPHRLDVPLEYETIQIAINVAEDGDTVLVQPGEYQGNINFLGRDVTVASMFLLDEDEAQIAGTILNGDGNGSVVTFEQREARDAVLIGFTIRGGNAPRGGGIYCEGASPIISHCVITENSALTAGGIGCYDGANAVIRYCRIINNQTINFGGGMRCVEANPVIEYCVFAENRATTIGGGIEFFNSSPTMTYTSLFANRCEAEQGGGLTLSGCDNFTISNCTIADNDGFGIHSAASEGEISNSIIWNNTPRQARCANQQLTITFSDLQGLENGVIGNVILGDGVINADPLFVDPEVGDYHLLPASPSLDAGNPLVGLDPDGTVLDQGAYYFHQRDIEVAEVEFVFEPISAGETDSLSFVISNTGGNALTINRFNWANNAPRFRTREEEAFGIEAQGEYEVWIYFIPDEVGEYQGSFMIESDDPDEAEIIISVSGSALGICEDQADLPRAFGITNIYPNPFNSTTTINYSLPFASPVSLQICNTLGQLLETLLDRVMSAGSHNVIWEADQAPAGVYLVRMVDQTGGTKGMRKVVLVK